MLGRLAPLFVIALLVISGRASAQNWIEYRPTGAGFSVEMPGQWSESARDINSAAGPLKLYVASVNAAPTSYVSMYTVYPSAFRAGTFESTLDAMRDGGIAKVHGRLRSEEHLRVGNFPARMVFVETPDGRIIIGKFVIIGAALVQALVECPSGRENDPAIVHFLQSLKAVSP
jgi:hypothetical protein